MAAKAAGVRIGVGSDSYCTGLTPFGLQTLNEVHALADAGMSEMDAIVAATRSGAEILRIEQLTGTVEPGKAADLLVLAASPLADITKLARENMVLIMKDGQAVKNDL
jgi:imidazolonepropionase-like amidohydrolase